MAVPDHQRVSALTVPGVGVQVRAAATSASNRSIAGGKFGAVDAFFCPVAFRAQSYGLELPPAAAGYVKRLLDLPPMRAWYEAALAEPWRDEPHEEETRRMGRVLQDLRAAPATA